MKSYFIIAVCWVLFLAASNSSRAQNQPYAKYGVYVGITTPYHKIEGDFDGATLIYGPDDILAIPKIERRDDEATSAKIGR